MSEQGSSGVSTLGFASADDSEELARAELYGLLSRLWFAPPDEELMQHFKVAVTQAPESGGLLEASWQDLVGAFRGIDRHQAAREYDALFQSVGKPEVMLYGSYYLSGFLNEKPLADLRADLTRLGLARDEQRGETEDHVAFVFEVMRYLIAGDDVAVCNLEQQRRFFRTHVQPWVETLCDAVSEHHQASAYRSLAEFTRSFVQIEAQAFDLIE